MWLWLLKKDAFIFLLFVGVVSIFWWGRTTSSLRDMELEVPIIYHGHSEQFVFTSQLPNSITLVVRDNGQQLRKLKHQNLQLNINLSPYLSKEKDVLTLSADVLRPRLQEILPGSTTIQRIHPETIETPYQVQQVKTVPVVVQSNVSTAPQYQLIGEATITPDKIQIFGSQDDIRNIEYILTDSLHVSGLREDIRLTAGLIVPSGVCTSPSSVEVAWQVEQFTEKSFTLPIHILDVPVGKQIRLFPQQVNVVARVGISHFAEIKDTDFQAVCHYPSQASTSLSVSVSTTNKNISNIRFSPSSVEYIIQF